MARSLSLSECSSPFFRYHYTKGADAAAAASLSVTPREATRRPFASSIPPRAEWSQNNLPFIGDIRSHSNPGNRSPPSSPFGIFLSVRCRVLRSRFSVFCSRCNYFHSLKSSCKQCWNARAMRRKLLLGLAEASPSAAVEYVTPVLSRGLTRESPRKVLCSDKVRQG